MTYRYWIYTSLFFSLNLSLYAEKAQYWQILLLPLGECKEIEFSFRQEYRFALSDFKIVNIRSSLYIKRKINSFLEGEIHYNWINLRTQSENAFKSAHRIDIELNPHYNIHPQIEFKARNRYEIIKREHFPKLLQRFRQRLQLVVKIAFKCLKSYSFHNELFYDINNHDIFEFRFVPMEFTFYLGKEHSLQVFAMTRWQKFENTWKSQMILGTTLEF